MDAQPGAVAAVGGVMADGAEAWGSGLLFLGLHAAVLSQHEGGGFQTALGMVEDGGRIDAYATVLDLEVQVLGGDRKNTFNISTTSCFVIAGAGYKVAKHGNYAATSVSGASNVIKNHGVQFTDDIDKLNRSINEAGIVYLHAQLFAKAMKFVGPIRKALQFPTVFNLLGPLVNPSQPKCQLLGVANLDQMRLYNQVYQKLGIDFGIVNSIDGYDEISLTGDFKVTTNNYEKIFKPQDLGFEIAKPEEVRGGATEEEAKDIFDAVLENRALPAQKNIVLANAAFGIQVMEKGQKSIEECVEIARESIDSGKALATFKKFVEINS